MPSPRRRRRRSIYSSSPRGSYFLGAPSVRRRRRRGPQVLLALVAVLLLAGVAGGATMLYQRQAADERRRDAAHAFAGAWTRGDRSAMWRLVSTAVKQRHTRAAFDRAYRDAERAADVVAVQIRRRGALRDGAVPISVTAHTRHFGSLRGTAVLPTRGENGAGRIDWSPELVLPGLRAGEAVSRRTGRRPARGRVLAAEGSPPTDVALVAGLERLFQARLSGHAASTLRFGERVIARIPRVHGRSIHSTLSTRLTRAAQEALGDELGGVAVIRPRDGAVLALAGLAVSAPQPPGSTFKILTLAGALQHRVATPASTYPVRKFAVLSGVKLRNAGDEACGGTLAQAFAESCNSVFAPLGARLGARRLVALAERFGFNEQPRIPAAKPSTIATDLRDSLAVGASAIGQDRDLATPLQMASVAATIARRGVRIRPRIAREEPIVRRRVVAARVAAQVRDMMVGVVRGGTGTAAALPGVTVAGKTGTAELRPTADAATDPKNTDAWFVAFAPAERPQVAVAVMLVGAGHGGTTAAPIARRVLAAAVG